MDKLLKLKARKALIISEMRTLNDAETFDESAYKVSEEEVRTLTADIEREEKLVKMEEDSKRIVDAPVVAVVEKGAVVEVNEEEFRLTTAFATYLRDPAVNVDNKTRAVLNTLVAAEGGYLVPEVFMTNIIDKLLEVSVMRQNSSVIRTMSTTNIPLGDGRPTFAIIAENGLYPQTDASFGQAVLGAFKIGGIIKASDELIQDAFTNIEAYITKLSVEGISDAEEAYFTTGTGTAQAQGIVTGSDLGITTVAIAAVTSDEVIKLSYSVKAPYRVNGKYMMNSKTELAIRILKDTNGQYLWQPALTLGAPNMFNGYPVIINEKVSDMGTGNKFMTFGNMEYYQIADRGQMAIKRLDELYSANGQVGYRVDKRADAKLLVTEAVKHMINA
jgi:HK97 family phage major capsid protein